MGEVAAVNTPVVAGVRRAAGGAGDHPMVGQQRHAGHRLAQEAAAVAAQIHHDGGRRLLFCQARFQRLAQPLRRVADEAADPHHQHVADALGEHRLRRHVGQRQRGRARDPVQAAQPHHHLAALGAGQPVARPVQRAGARPVAVDAQHPIAHADAGLLAGAVRHQALHQHGTAPRDQPDSGAGVDRQLGPLVFGRRRRLVAGVGVEVVEHLVEEALDQALRAGRAQRGRQRKRGGLQVGRGVPPAGRVVRRRRVAVVDHAVRCGG